MMAILCLLKDTSIELDPTLLSIQVEIRLLKFCGRSIGYDVLLHVFVYPVASNVCLHCITLSKRGANNLLPFVTLQVPDACRLRRRGRRREVSWGHPRPRQEDCVPLHPLLSCYFLSIQYHV